MTDTMGSATQWLHAARKGWLLWSGIACYVLATPFLALITWSAAQVWLGGMAHALDAQRIGAIAAIAIARHHAVPFTVFAAASLAIAFVGGALVRRAVGPLPAETEGA